MLDYGQLYDTIMGDKRFNPGGPSMMHGNPSTHGGPSMMQRKSEIVWLLETIEDNGGVNGIVEIGSLFGGNLVMLSTLLDPTNIIVSIEPELESKLEVDLINEYIDCKMHHIKKYSTDPVVMDEVLDIFKYGGPILVFVDGMHDTNSVLVDSEIARNIVRDEGYIALHDIVKPSVKTAWNEVRSKYHMTLESVDPLSAESVRRSGQDGRGDNGWGGIGLVRIGS